MTGYDPEIHHRHSIRLKGYDYSSGGSYFVTICTHNKTCLLGKIINSQMILNDAGEMINRTWNEIPRYYLGIKIDAFQIMPNHIHGIIILANGQPRGVAPTEMSLADVVHRLKTMTTKRYSDGVKQNGWMPFLKTFWQRNYYEHIIRNETSLHKIRQYIMDNPKTWTTDQLNPQCTSPAKNDFPITAP